MLKTFFIKVIYWNINSKKKYLKTYFVVKIEESKCDMIQNNLIKSKMYDVTDFTIFLMK